MTKKTMAVLIPTWKRPEKLRKCLQALTSSDMMPDAIYVVHRPEDTESATVIESFLNSLPITKVLVNEPGVIYAENAGLKQVKEDYICFLDDDAYVPTHWCRVIHEKLSSDANIIGVGGPDIIFQDLKNDYRRIVNKVGMISSYGRLTGNHHHEVKQDMIVDVLKGVNMSFRREFVPQLDQELQSSIREGNGSHWELDICLQMSKHGKFLFTPELELQHDSNHSHFIEDKVAVNNARNYTYVILKNFTFFKKIAFLFYVMSVGNTNAFGILKCVQELLSQRRLRPLKIYGLNLLGIYKGIRTYITS